MNYTSRYIKCFDLSYSLAVFPKNLAAFNIPEICPQIHDLPRPQSNQHSHRAKRKPLDPLIRTLIRIPKLLFSRPQIVHLPHNLRYQLLNAPKLRLNRLQLLLRLNGRPVAGVGADVDVQFDMAGGRHDGFYGSLSVWAVLGDGWEKEGRTGCDELVLEADVKCGVRVGCKCHSCFADDVFGSPVLIAYGVLDLAEEWQISRVPNPHGPLGVD